MERKIHSKLIGYTIFSLWALLFLSAASWVLVGSVSYWVKHGWLPPDSSGWAQAIGGLLAVIVAITVPAFQNFSQSRQLKEKEELVRLEGIQATRALVEHVLRVQKRLLSALKLLGSQKGIYSPLADAKAESHEAIQAAAMLREISVVDLNIQMVHFVVRLREVANFGEFAGNQHDHYQLLGYANPDVVSQLQRNTETLNKWVEELDDLEAFAK
ncbi:hypothetical protein [Pseudomonas sp. HLMP]|uniref:hypothetical protein n=1 Tax=Pseudomonas sp. HLMP TaxID=3153767 RepID=UPI00396795E6